MTDTAKLTNLRFFGTFLCYHILTFTCSPDKSRALLPLSKENIMTSYFCYLAPIPSSKELYSVFSLSPCSLQEVKKWSIVFSVRNMNGLPVSLSSANLVQPPGSWSCCQDVIVMPGQNCGHRNSAHKECYLGLKTLVCHWKMGFSLGGELVTQRDDQVCSGFMVVSHLRSCKTWWPRKIRAAADGAIVSCRYRLLSSKTFT